MIMNVDFMYPIGSIYISVNSTNPSKYFGGTWVSWGTGRVPVGVDTSQTEFDSVEKTGGSKYLQAHTHRVYSANNTNSAGSSYNNIAFLNGAAITNNGQLRYTTSDGTGNSGNLQPYITCYMWKRTT